MKKMLPLFIVLIIIAGTSYYYLAVRDDSEESQSSTYLTDKRILELSQSPSELVNFIGTVKENPSQVIRTNNILRKMVYSGEYSEADIESLVNMQRLLFQEELLNNNPKEYHQIRIKAELERWEEVGLKIIGSDYLPPEYQDDDLAIFKVVFYTNDTDFDIYAQYVLSKEDTGWEILGWTKADAFEIVK